MPTEGGASRFRSKRMGVMRRLRSQTDGEVPVSRLAAELETESLLPPPLRNRLYNLFGQIEREFESLYAENMALQEKIEVLNERLEGSVGGDKIEGADLPDGVGHGVKSAMKKSGSHISQKLKLTYKTSTSKLVSSFRGATSGSQLVNEFRGHRDGVWEVNTSKTDGKIIGTASADHSARIWWVDNASCLMQYLGHSGSVNSVRFHPQQDMVVTASGDQTAHIWRAQVSSPAPGENLVGCIGKSHSSGEEEAEGSEREEADGHDSSDDKQAAIMVRQPVIELLGHNSVVIAADWMSSGSQVMTASWDRTANLYDVESGVILNSFPGHDQELTNVCTHPTQQLVVTSSKDTTFRLLDLRDPSMQVNVFQGHQQPVTTAVFAGEKVVSGSDDRTVKVWDLKNMRSPIATIRNDAPVNRLAVMTSNNTIAIPLDNRHIRLYDITGVRLGRLPRSNRQGHSRMVCAVAWGEKDNLTSNLYSCGFDRQVLGWNLNWAGTKE